MPTILFVCTANIIRSPTAEGLLKAKLGERRHGSGWEVRSAGAWGKDGMPASSEIVDILRDRGIYMPSHRSRIVNQAVLKNVDLILTMEQSHKEGIIGEFPEKKRRTFLLSEMVGKNMDVVDPIGESQAAFDKTVDEIDNFLEEGFDKILDLAQEFAKEL